LAPIDLRVPAPSSPIPSQSKTAGIPAVFTLLVVPL
jgi:hypothetical protein